MCLLLNKPHMCVPHTGKTVHQVGVIILSVVVLVQTILLVGALVKIVLLTEKSETNMSLIHNYQSYSTQSQSRRQEKRGWRWM